LAFEAHAVEPESWGVGEYRRHNDLLLFHLEPTGSLIEVLW
jgi:hypothetical protein